MCYLPIVRRAFCHANRVVERHVYFSLFFGLTSLGALCIVFGKQSVKRRVRTFFFVYSVWQTISEKACANLCF